MNWLPDELSWLGFPGEFSINWLGLREAQKRTPLTAEQIALLRRAAFSTHGANNALSEPGLALMALEAKGYVRSVGRRPDERGGWWIDYKRTPAGKRALADVVEAERKAGLAALGVREIAPDH